ncbi:MAG: hypothetical protein ACLGHZ_03250 [Actinomycetes bacterium]
MDPNVLHLVVAGALTVVFVIITALVWKRAQVKTVFWWIGLTLVPLAIYLAGLAPLAVGAYESLRLWWLSLAFTPVVWVGLVMGGLAALLMLGSRLIPSESYRDRRAAAKASGPKGAVAKQTPAAERPAVASKSSANPPQQPAPKGKQAAGGDAEMDEIAELLRKRGIN